MSRQPYRQPIPNIQAGPFQNIINQQRPQQTLQTQPQQQICSPQFVAQQVIIPQNELHQSSVIYYPTVLIPSQQQQLLVMQQQPQQQYFIQQQQLQQQQQNVLPKPRPKGLDIDSLKDKEQFLKFLDSFADRDNYFCQICQNIIWEAAGCSKCNKLFCQPCLQIWLQEKQSCPCCREKFEAKKQDQSVISNLARLAFYCPYKEKGCQNTLQYEGFAKHLEECNYEIVKCTNPGCDFEDMRMKYLEHNPICPHFEMNCQHCYKKKKRQIIQEHEENCELKIIQCSNEGCQSKLPKIKISNHDQECSFKIVTCNKCNEQFKRIELIQHDQDCGYNQIVCPGCKQTFYKKDYDEHFQQCDEVEIICQQCKMVYQKKQKQYHTEIRCLQHCVMVLQESKTQQDTIIQNLLNENIQINKTLDQMKLFIDELYRTKKINQQANENNQMM